MALKHPPWIALLAALAIATALWNLHGAARGLHVAALDLDGTPATVYRPEGDPPAPVVVIAHGFAGSQQLMQSFALDFARNGYTAVTFDFPGHGRNARPLAGSLTELDGATRTLVASLAGVAREARGLGDGRIAVLGHSMATDIVVRYAESDPEVAGTIAVSMFSPAVTATAPRNLLVITGDWEGTLKREALRAVGLATAPAPAQPGVTYGDPAAGTGRRFAISPHVEHVSVLYSQASSREAIAWLDQCFGIARTLPLRLAARGPWILLLVAGIALLARSLAQRLPLVARPHAGAARGWRRLWLPLLVPMLATPLLLRVLPTRFLPVVVGDYLATHFALYGLLPALGLYVTRRRGAARPPPLATRLPLAAAAFAMTAFGLVALAWPIDRYVTSFMPGPGRVVLTLAMLAGTLAYFLGDEWLTRGEGAARGGYLASKLAFLLSLAGAVALDFERLFFLVIIVPVMVLFFLVHGLFSHWAYRQTGHPFVAGFANAIAFAWAIGVTFPLVAG